MNINNIRGFFSFLAKHPEIKSLMVIDHLFKYQVTALVFLQFSIISALSYFDVAWPIVVLITYIVGGTINQSLLLAIHEISHNMAFGHAKPIYNRIFSLFANLPIGVPMALSFKKYHLEHHRYLGHDIIDTDIPTELEAKMFSNTLGKAIWMFLQPFFYAFRPLMSYPKEVCKIEAFNFVMQFAFDAFIGYYLGPKAVFYMILGSLLGMGMHPVAGHFIAEHYMFSKGFETYSYYGILNKVTFNVGYHNEHHDFPNVPGSLLPKVREYAPEYYNNIPYHTSWVNVIYKFITDPSVGLYARMKRNKYDEEKHKLAKNLDKME